MGSEGNMVESSGNVSALIGVHYQEIRGLLWAITHNEATADELAQETFIVALKKNAIHNLAGDGMRLWLRETARRLAMNELRRKRPLALEPETLGSVSAADTSTEDGPTFSDELSALRECMADLSDKDRELLAARYEHGISVAEIAQKLKLSPDYVKLKLFRLRRALGERIKRKVASYA